MSRPPVHGVQHLAVFTMSADELIGDDLAQVVQQAGHEGVFRRFRQNLAGDGLGTDRAGDAVLPKGIEVERSPVLLVEQVDHADAEHDALEDVESQQDHGAPYGGNLLDSPVEGGVGDLEDLQRKGLVFFDQFGDLPGVHVGLQGLLHDCRCDGRQCRQFADVIQEGFDLLGRQFYHPSSYRWNAFQS